MGALTTHVLDTTTGRPAAELDIELWRLHEAQWTQLGTFTTNSDGRVPTPMLHGEHFVCGVYELRFHAGSYLSHQVDSLPQPPFLDVVPIRFGISDPQAHYHVPLLLSAHGYSTYRGS